MRVEVDGQHFDVPDDATTAEIDAITKPAQQDTHGTLAKVAHYGAKALPAVGGVGGAMLAGAPAIPTGPGALLTGAAGAGLGAMSGKALQKSIDQYLGYEQPDLKRDLIDVGTTGLRDATYATGAGVATAGLARAAPAIAGALEGGALATGRRILRNVGGSISKAKALPDEAVREAFDQGAFRFGGTSGGAAERLEAARESVGQKYATILSDLEKQGITGPEAQRLAQQYAQRAQTVSAGSMNPAVPQVYETAAQQVAGKPTTAGRLGLSQTEELKRSMQGMAKSAYQQRQPTEVGQSHEEAASMMRQAVEDEIAQQSANASPAVQDAAARFVPVKQQAGRLIQASNVAREGMDRAKNRAAISLPDWLAVTAELTRSHSPLQAAASGLATHMLRTRGPSSAATFLKGASDIAGAFPSVAPQVERAAMSLSPAAAERMQIEAMIQALLKKSTPAPQLADASQ